MRTWPYSLLSLVIAAMAASSANAGCYSPREFQASLVRQLQSELMVAALSCSRHPQLDLPAKYNAFVRKFAAELAQNANVLRGHFGRHYGMRRETELDSFITRLANEASARAMSVDDYCRTTSPLFDRVLAIDNEELEAFAAEAPASSRLVTACGG